MEPEVFTWEIHLQGRFTSKRPWENADAQRAQSMDDRGIGLST